MPVSRSAHFRCPAVAAISSLRISIMAHGSPRERAWRFQREIDPVGRRIGLVVSDQDALEAPQRRNQRRRDALVVVVDDPDLPRARHLLVDRGEGMDRHQVRLPPFRQPPLDDRLYGFVKGTMRERDARRPLDRRDMRIAGDRRRLADRRNEVGRVERPIAVDHQPRDPGFDQHGIERPGHALGDRRGARIPGDVAGKLLAAEAERAEMLGDAVRGMVADEHERAAARPVGRPD